MARICRHPHKEIRRQSAQQLAEARAMRTSAQQLVELDRRLGVGVGARRERARLARQVAQGNKKAA